MDFPRPHRHVVRRWRCAIAMRTLARRRATRDEQARPFSIFRSAMDGSSRSETVAETRAASVMLAIALVATVATWLLFLLDRAPGTRAALAGFPLDDAWIHLVYARGLVTEGGFHYNPGVPEAGMTSPLWVVLLAPVFAIARGFGPTAVVVAAKTLSLAGGLAGTVLVSRLSRALGLGAVVSSIAALLFAIDPSLTFSRAAGMEVPLFVALVLATLLAARRGRWWAAGIAQGLAIVARPEGILLVPFAAFLLARSASPKAMKQVALAAACAALPALLYAAFCLHATGAPLPNTFYVKFHAGNPLSVENLMLGWSDYVHGNLPYFTIEVGTVLMLLGAVDVVRRAGAAGAATLGAFIALFVGTLASREFGAGHYHYWERWLIPSFPGLLIAMAAGLGTLWNARESQGWLMPSRDAGRGNKPRRREAKPSPPSPAAPPLAVMLLAPLVGIVLVWSLPRTLIDRAHTFAWNCQNIDEVDVALGTWVDANLPKGAVIAVSDAGALRYFGRRVTIDLLGLNDHHIRHALAERRGARYLEDRGVGWLVVFPSVYPDLVAMLGVEPVHEARSAHYTVSGAEQDVMVVYRWNRTAR
jgi:hypothetical protein